MILDRLAGVNVAERSGDVLPTKQHLAISSDGADGAEHVVGKCLNDVAHNKAPILRAK